MRNLRKILLLQCEEVATIMAVNFLTKLDVKADPIGAKFHVEQISNVFMVRCFDISPQLDKLIINTLKESK